MKRIVTLLLALAMLLSMTACGGTAASGNAPEVSSSSVQEDPAVTNTPGTAETEPDPAGEQPAEAAPVDLSNVKIGMIGIMDAGPTFESWKTTYEQISAVTGITFEYALGNSFDDGANLTTVQNLIASGCNGIIVMMDSGLQAIAQECQAAGVYFAGFGSDFRNFFDQIKDNPYFLGTVKDGPMTGAELGKKAAELAIQDGKKNIGVITFPQIYFPVHAEAVEGFMEEIDAFNASAAEGDKITVYDAVELPFEPLDPTYFQQNPDVDAIFGPATANFIYPTMVSANRTDVTLYADGYDNSESVIQAFNDGVIRLQCIYNSEVLAYPIAMIANAVSGQPYVDAPAEPEVVPVQLDFITTAEEQAAFESKTVFNGNSSVLLTEDTIRKLFTAANPDATYEELVSTVQSWNMEYILAH